MLLILPYPKRQLSFPHAPHPRIASACFIPFGCLGVVDTSEPPSPLIQGEPPLAGSFSDAWAGLDSGVGVREEPDLSSRAVQSESKSAQDEAWADAGSSALAP